MKKHASTIILILVFIVGLSVMLYPTVSNLVNQRSQSRAIASYQEQVENLREEEYQTIIQSAETYNRALRVNNFNISDSDAMTEAYLRELSVVGGSVMGYLEIAKINVRLAIYHGVDEAVLQIGIGHLPQTSLPVGGEGTHSVLSGHTGLPSANLLSGLDRLVKGDRFRVTILNEVYEYAVDQILVVLPDELDSLGIVEGADYLTLVTCTPYGVNSHRLLVRGVRTEPGEALSGMITEDAVAVDPLIVATVLAVPVLLVLLAVILLRYRKSRP